MKHTTLCYIENAGKYLMIHRIKKENDENNGKWIGIGGKLEPGESPFDCARREIYEETGLEVPTLKYRGFITFVSDLYGTEYMHLFTADTFSGEIVDSCDEGDLKWIKKKDLRALPMWAGDAIFLKLLEEESRFFSLKLVYHGDNLIDHKIHIQ